MKKITRRKLRKGIRILQAKYYCKFSTTEHELLSEVMRKLKKKESNKNLVAPVLAFLNKTASIVKHLF